ncbi:monocarboxylate transporter 2-like [Macrobrachium nipponense]|uniref:monocarboxylate transporter 2-like n=1 Tax=Macrobrachium nipponense TaxID=159736 RepID=UPI0030C8BD69
MHPEREEEEPCSPSVQTASEKLELLPHSKSRAIVTKSPRVDGETDGDDDVKIPSTGIKNDADIDCKHSEASLSASDKGVRREEPKLSVKEPDAEEAEEDDRLPDGGWGWVVVFGASLILVLVDTMGQCFGIIFSTFLLHLETTTTMTAWIFNLFSFIWSMTGPPLGALINEFGWRPLTFVGSFLLTIATITSAFVSAAWVLFFTYSLLAGIGCGIISNISYMIVPHYFKKRRGLANGIIMAWDCGGQLIGPPLIGMLQDEYSFKGATLIVGGVILNSCIGAAVFHPVEWHKRPKTPKIHGTHNTAHLIKNPVEAIPRKKTPESIRTIMMRLVKSTVKDLGILKSLKAIIISIGVTVILNGYLNFLAFVPFAMQEAGYTLGEAAQCVSVSAICNMVTRVIVATLSDGKKFNFQISMMVGSMTISATMICFTLTEDLTTIKVIMGIWGCGVGTFMSIFNLTMVHYMGLENFTSMLGASMLCLAFGYLTIGPFAGYVKDASQSYSSCIWVLSGIVSVAFISWMFMPAAVAYDLRREQRKNEERLEIEEKGNMLSSEAI